MKRIAGSYVRIVNDAEGPRLVVFFFAEEEARQKVEVCIPLTVGHVKELILELTGLFSVITRGLK